MISTLSRATATTTTPIVRATTCFVAALSGVPWLLICLLAAGIGKVLRAAASDLRDLARHFIDNAAEEHRGLLDECVSIKASRAARGVSSRISVLVSTAASTSTTAAAAPTTAPAAGLPVTNDDLDVGAGADGRTAPAPDQQDNPAPRADAHDISGSDGDFDADLAEEVPVPFVVDAAAVTAALASITQLAAGKSVDWLEALHTRLWQAVHAMRHSADRTALPAALLAAARRMA
jgi:hypothetical protein